MKLKKIYCYMLLLVLLINAPISTYAQATATTPTVTIAAGTGAAVGGAYQGYTSKTAAAATALTLAVLSATGAAVKLTEASVQAGKTVYQVINDKFAQWVGGTSAEDLTPSQAEELQSRFKVITGGGGNSEDPDNNDDNGTNISEDGKLWFSPGSLAMLEKFTDFLQSQDDGVMVMPEASGTGQTVNGTWLGSVYEFNNINNLVFYTNNTTTPANMNLVNVGLIQIQLSSGKFQLVSYLKGSKFRSSQINKNNGSWGGGNAQTSTTAGGYYYMSEGTSTSMWHDVSLFLGGSISDYLNSLNGEWDIQNASAEITSDGIYGGENWSNDILRNPNSQIFVVDPGILNGFDVDSDRQISIPDYLNLIIQQAEEKAKREAQPEPSPAPQELPVPLLDPITGTKSPANWNDPKPDDAIQDPAESEKKDPDPEDPKDPVIDDDTPTDPEDAIELLKVDLTRIFPFCIPWDLYRLFSKFNAEPITPSVTIDWGDILGTFGIDYVTTLDLHDYDNVASILRTMETVAFVVGLAVATRSIFLRS